MFTGKEEEGVKSIRYKIGPLVDYSGEAMSTQMFHLLAPFIMITIANLKYKLGIHFFVKRLNFRLGCTSRSRGGDNINHDDVKHVIVFNKGRLNIYMQDKIVPILCTKHTLAHVKVEPLTVETLDDLAFPTFVEVICGTVYEPVRVPGLLQGLFNYTELDKGMMKKHICFFIYCSTSDAHHDIMQTCAPIKEQMTAAKKVVTATKQGIRDIEYARLTTYAVLFQHINFRIVRDQIGMGEEVERTVAQLFERARAMLILLRAMVHTFQCSRDEVEKKLSSFVDMLFDAIGY